MKDVPVSQSMMLRQEQKPQQVLLQEQVLHQADIAYISTAIASLSTLFVQQMEKLSIGNLTGSNTRGVAFRVARESTFRLANEYFPFSTSLQDGHGFETVKKTVHETLCTLLDSMLEFTPSSSLPAEHMFTKQSSMHERPEVADCLQIIEKTFLQRPELRSTYDHVRSAAYGCINADTIDELLPKIEESYERAWLDMPTIEKLKDNNPYEVAEFKKRTKKGIFVFGFHEKLRNGKTIAGQMSEDFKEKPDPNKPHYKGNYLMDAKGDLLAWMTYWDNPASRGYKKMINHYLHHGETGGKMRYMLKPKKYEFMPQLGRILMIDTIRGEEPFAASRLFAKTLQDIASTNRTIESFVGYRLHELLMEPPFQGFQDATRYSENISSAVFFEKRLCMSFAYDFSGKGPRSERIQTGGIPMYLNPEWVAFSGKFREVLQESWSIWRKTQSDFGDISSDDYKKSVVDYDFLPPRSPIISDKQ